MSEYLPKAPRLVGGVFAFDPLSFHKSALPLIALPGISPRIVTGRKG
ncbi:hypothetical protein [Mesorhizobium abyssinicae]